jgi:hypothetical protein
MLVSPADSAGRDDPAASFLADKYVYRAASKCPVLANLILEEALVGLFHILGQVSIEHEGRNLRVGHLSHIFNLDILTLD